MAPCKGALVVCGSPHATPRNCPLQSSDYQMKVVCVCHNSASVGHNVFNYRLWTCRFICKMRAPPKRCLIPICQSPWYVSWFGKALRTKELCTQPCSAALQSNLLSVCSHIWVYFTQWYWIRNSLHWGLFLPVFGWSRQGGVIKIQCTCTHICSQY